MICFGQGNTPGTNYPPQPDGNVGTCGLLFGSNHPMGLQCVLCDGSVRSVRYSVDPANWTIFCQIYSNSVIDWSSF